MLAPVAGEAGQAATDTDRAQRALFEMRAAFQKGDSARLATLLPLVQGHPLEAIAAYWALRSRLETATEDEIRAFLGRWQGSYWEDRLRNDWLLLLGQQRNWATLLQESAAFRMQDDPEVHCYTALARVETGQARPAEVAAAVRDTWLAQRTEGAGCAAAVQRLIAAGALTPEVAWQRARWGIEAGRLPIVRQALGVLDTGLASQVEELYRAPQRYLRGKIETQQRRSRGMITLALLRLAALDPSAAAEQADQLRAQVAPSAEEHAWIWGAIGKRAAQRLSDDAVRYFARADDALLSNDFRAWKVRAALRAGDWTTVRRTIESMSDAQRREPIWTYWLARALQASGRAQDDAAARALFERIAGSEGFYEQLAAEALGQALVLPPVPTPPTAAERAAVRAKAGLRRALLAIEMGLRAEGVREWHYEVALHNPGGLGERELLAAAEWACERGVWDRCINTSARTRDAVHIGQRYPMPLRELVMKHAQAIGLDPAYVYGLIRQESRFVADARSRVGASGLMQVMPATARWTARKIGLTSFQPDQITDPDINVRLGTAYLKFLLDDVDGSATLAAAAFNAGPRRLRQWCQGPELEAAVWIENIPFDETRDYVQRVLSNTAVYAAILGDEPVRLGERLGRVGAPLATARALQPDSS